MYISCATIFLYLVSTVNLLHNVGTGATASICLPDVGASGKSYAGFYSPAPLLYTGLLICASVFLSTTELGGAFLFQ